MVIISNGFCKFHLAPLASEMSKRHLLDRFITGAYPTQRVLSSIGALRLTRVPEITRLVDRAEPIPANCIVSLVFPEIIYQAAIYMRRFAAFRPLSFWLNGYSFRLYGRLAEATCRQVDAKDMIYHYRAGMGHSSVKLAKKRGMFALCDHSIAHPAVVDYLVENGGNMPANGSNPEISDIEMTLLSDIDQADEVLVNSDFVKLTFLERGWDPARVHVIYLGVDDAFLNYVTERNPIHSSTPTRLLFAGHFASRKGGEVLVKALQRINDMPWQIEIAGSVSPAIYKSHPDFFKDQRVTLLGTLSRCELARCMGEADVFVFPSLAEGSARVVFEALATGCYVITTPNAGSIVQDGIHGALVPPGDIERLETAIRNAIAMGKERAEIGQKNASLIRARYRQTHYGDAVEQLYRQLIREKTAVSL